MLYPSINDLLKVVDSRYTLVVAASKRARQLINGERVKVEANSRKPVSMATQEIFEKKVTYQPIQEGKNNVGR